MFERNNKNNNNNNQKQFDTLLFAFNWPYESYPSTCPESIPLMVFSYIYTLFCSSSLVSLSFYLCVFNSILFLFVFCLVFFLCLYAPHATVVRLPNPNSCRSFLLCQLYTNGSWKALAFVHIYIWITHDTLLYIRCRYLSFLKWIADSSLRWTYWTRN